jgi:hypothetical protein
LFEHDLFGKPRPTFPDHALGYAFTWKAVVPENIELAVDDGCHQSN